MDIRMVLTSREIDQPELSGGKMGIIPFPEQTMSPEAMSCNLLA